MATIKEGVAGGVLAPNEGRKRINLGPKPGGETPYLQQQYYGLAALSRRDQQAPAPATPGATPPEPKAIGESEEPAQITRWREGLRHRGLAA
jgi:phage portal protein BeeE